MKIYIDISNTYINNAKTGIQRVVRELSFRLKLQRSDVFFITFDRKQEQFFLLHKIGASVAECLSKKVSLIPFSITSFKAGDIFLDIDASWGNPLDRTEFLPKIKSLGVKVGCLHYDAVPVLHPQYSHPNTVYRYLIYISAHLRYADFFICISKTVEKDLSLIARKVLNRNIKSHVIPLGSNFTMSRTNEPIDILQKLGIEKNKYILAVGTIEPRKNYTEIVNAFDATAEKIDLSLVLVGKIGWCTEDLITKIKNHPLYNKRIFLLNSVDDQELSFLYQNSYLCINASHYEGNGSPLVEALSHGCVIICPIGGALEEVSNGYAYLINDNTKETIANSFLHLYENKDAYSNLQIKAKQYTPISWDLAFTNFSNILDKEIDLPKEYFFDFMPSQACFITINPENLKLSLESIANNMVFIKKLIILTNDKQKANILDVLSKFNFEYIIVTDEELISTELNSALDHHTQRNTFLRKQLYSHDRLEPNFIQFDDDYLVQAKVNLDFYIHKGRHRIYYYQLSESNWLGTPYIATSYDEGIWNTAELLSSMGYAKNIYSSHMPQIINKKLISEVFMQFIHENSPAIDEWSIYFNVVCFLFPKKFQIRKYKTLCWSNNPTDWLPECLPDDYIFENYYPSNYSSKGQFENLSAIGDLELKIKKWTARYAPFYEQIELNREQFSSYNPIFYVNKDLEISGVKIWRVKSGALLRLPLLFDFNKKTNVFFNAAIISTNQETIMSTSKGKITAQSKWIPIWAPKELGTYTLKIYCLSADDSIINEHNCLIDVID